MANKFVIGKQYGGSTIGGKDRDEDVFDSDFFFPATQPASSDQGGDALLIKFDGPNQSVYASNGAANEEISDPAVLAKLGPITTLAKGTPEYDAYAKLRTTYPFVPAEMRP